MDYFDEKNEFDNLDKKIFDDNYKKQIKYTKKIFKILGIIFFFIGNSSFNFIIYFKYN